MSQAADLLALLEAMRQANEQQREQIAEMRAEVERIGLVRGACDDCPRGVPGCVCDPAKEDHA